MVDTIADPLADPTDVPDVVVSAVVICPHCARSLVHESGSLRLAVAADTVDLSDDTRAVLRSAQRAAVNPPARRAKR